MKSLLTSVVVGDQAKALAFYTDVLGFVKKQDPPIGEYKWLTVVPPEGPGDIKLLLEPNANPTVQIYQKALFEQGIPATAFDADDIRSEYERMTKLGVELPSAPMQQGPVTTAMFDDTCGNLIQIYQVGKP